MKKRLFTTALIVMATMSVWAQKVTTVDTDGNVIPLVSILTEDGVLIGTTDLHGVLADVKGVKKVSVSHVAFKPQTVNVAELKNGRIVMEEVDYNLSEVVVKPKPFLYIEYYYRAFSYIEDSLRIYSAGIIPVIHDLKNMGKGKTRTLWSYGGAANKALGWNIVSLEIDAEKGAKQAIMAIETAARKSEKFINYYKTTIEEIDDKHWTIKNPEGIVGHFHYDDGLYRATLDAGKMQIYANKVNGEDKMAKRREDRDYTYQYTEVFKLDEEGHVKPENIVMDMSHWTYESKKGKKIIILYLYAADRGYVDEDEFKARSKELNKGYAGDMPLIELEKYEQAHHIPPLSAAQQMTIREMKKKTGEK